jgi:type II secretory ATPase GspE/PulE/Tfp pilus assembly ATPase PilB-like protein
MSNLFVDKLLGPKASNLKGGDDNRRLSSSDKAANIDSAVDKVLSKQREMLEPVSEGHAVASPPLMEIDETIQEENNSDKNLNINSPSKQQSSGMGFGIFSKFAVNRDSLKVVADIPEKKTEEKNEKPSTSVSGNTTVSAETAKAPNIENNPKQFVESVTPKVKVVATPKVAPRVINSGVNTNPVPAQDFSGRKLTGASQVDANSKLLFSPIEEKGGEVRKSRAAELIALKKAEISGEGSGVKKARRPLNAAPVGSAMPSTSKVGTIRTNLAPHETEALIQKAGNLLTGPGGPLERRPEQREIMALFESGLLLISKFHIDDPHTTSFIGLLRRKGMTVDVVASDLGVIAKCYDESEVGDVDGVVRADGEATVMQRDIIRFVGECARLKASDAHVVVDQTSTRVRIRVDGILRDYTEWRSVYGSDFCAAAFAMADASDASYQPYEYQAARISDSSVRLPNGVQALRLQFNPLSYGGRHMVMRFLYRSSGNVGDVDTLGYAQKQIHHIKRIRATPMGINIVAGPTGSGKSTTLQRILVTLMRERRNEISVFTVEDPPEYVIAGAQQMPVTNASTAEERKEKFNAAIRASLRSDPDVIMIGEIRDAESAKLAFEAAMTGHQVWATLHAVDCLTIISRLRDIGVDEFKLFDPAVFTGLIGQRLLRALCKDCKVPIMQARDQGEIPDDQWERILAVFGRDLDGIFHQGKGCPTCNGSGCKGRSVVAEVLLPDDDFMALARNENKVGARRHWIDSLHGLTMMGHGILKVSAGEVSPDEVERMLGLLELDRVRPAPVVASPN